MNDFPLAVTKFKYNGFAGNSTLEPADFTAQFVQWTDDPGIGIFKCSDDRFRTIPGYSIVGHIPDIPRIEPENVISDGLKSSDTHPGYATVEEILELHKSCERGQIDSLAHAIAMTIFDVTDEEMEEMEGEE